jgi:hypothetical protein
MEEKKQLTDMQSLFLELLMTPECRGNIRLAMKEAGYADTTSISAVVGPLQKEINEKASLMLAMNAPKAAYGLSEVLDNPEAMGARNSIAAAAQILDRTGLIKKEQVEVNNTGGAMFILPPKNDD